MIKAVLFDLDGTLLPMDQDLFIKAYFGALVRALAPRGYDETLPKAIWKGTEAMIKNDGGVTNEDKWWTTFCGIYGEGARQEEKFLEHFYATDFNEVSKACGYSKEAREVIDLCKERGFRVILATNPVFPRIATSARARWAGLELEDFEHVTSYENSHFAKPNLDYYREILERTGLDASECVMVGNDVTEDMVTERLGMKTFLLTDCLINKNGEDISRFPRGSFAELKEFINSL